MIRAPSLLFSPRKKKGGEKKGVVPGCLRDELAGERRGERERGVLDQQNTLQPQIIEEGGRGKKRKWLALPMPPSRGEKEG